MSEEPVEPDEAADVLVVYWRPGCPFCHRLFSVLDRAGVRVQRENIWEDEAARAFVMAHNDGNETVPTVVLGDRVLTNPDPPALVAAIGRDYPALLEAADSPRRPSTSK